MNQTKKIAGGILLFSALFLSGCTLTSDSDDTINAPQIDEAAIAAAVSKSLESKLDESIDKGIQRYVDKQQQDQQAAQANQQKAANEKAKNVKGLQADDHLRGNKNPDIVLIEYSDVECPFCKRFHPTAKEMIAKDANVAWVYRHFPLNFHDPLATKEAIATECVAKIGGEEKFWKYLDLLYATTTSNGRGLKVEDLSKYASQVGVDGDAVQKCIDDGKIIEKVQQDIKEGSAAGVTGTPGNILLNVKTGETRLLPGAVPYSVIKQAIEELRK